MKKQLITLILLLGLVSMACSLPGLSDAVDTTAVETEAPLPSEILMASATVTVEPAPVETEATAPAGQPEVGAQRFDVMEFTCRNITIGLPDILADGIRCEVVPAQDDTVNFPPWEIQPEYDLLRLEGYTLQDRFHSPAVHVFPIEEYAALNENAADIIADLRQLLVDKPEAPQSIPFLPAFNAAQMLRVKVKYFDFASGSGVRFLTQYGQDAYPINNETFFYTYQGITADGRYYVAAVLPIGHSELPESLEDSIVGDWEAFYENFGIYIADTTLALNSYDDYSFLPAIPDLDHLVSSITIE